MRTTKINLSFQYNEDSLFIKKIKLINSVIKLL